MSESLDDLPEVADLAGPGMRLLLVGINPSPLTARTGFHFAHPGNRFYPALRRAGVLPETATTPELAAPVLIERGVGITNLSPRPTARADELDDEEVRAGRERVTAAVRAHGPRVVAVAGVTSYRVAFADRRARLGRQAHDLEGAELWVVPNPSGLNAHATIDSLARDYREVAEAAGVPLDDVPTLP